MIGQSLAPGVEHSLPRLMYVGRVPVEATSGGSALVYRLLERYPPEKLLIVEDFETPSMKSHRLPGVQYERLPKPWNRGWHFLRTRLPWAFWPLFKAYAGRVANRCETLIQNFRPEAILTVHELFTWVIADQMALQHKLPLHIILHDEWFRNIPHAGGFRGPSERVIGEVYRRAASRLCVCPYMEELYRSRFGCNGTVLYPSRSPSATAHRLPPDGLQNETAHPVGVYAGNIHHLDYLKSMQSVADALATMGGKLVLYTSYSSEQCARDGLTASNVECRKMVPWGTLSEKLRGEAHFLFVPMSFDVTDKPNASVSFPSKIVDYTATGIPLLIYGPEYSSAIRWAKDNPGTAEFVDQESPLLLSAAVKRLAEDGSHRFRLGMTALDVGQRCFSHEAAEGILFRRLARQTQ
jgi:hypothetical protein